MNGGDEEIKAKAPSFCLFFEQLALLLSDNVIEVNELPALPTPQLPVVVQESAPVLGSPSFPSRYPSQSSSSIPKKRPNSVSLVSSSPPEVPALSFPDNVDVPPTTIPKDPKYSGDSAESIDEDNTSDMIRTLIRFILFNLGMDFRQVSWPSYTGPCSLILSGYYRSSIPSNLQTRATDDSVGLQVRCGSE
jgi:hypothetical protein